LQFNPAKHHLSQPSYPAGPVPTRATVPALTPPCTNAGIHPVPILTPVLGHCLIQHHPRHMCQPWPRPIPSPDLAPALTLSRTNTGCQQSSYRGPDQSFRFRALCAFFLRFSTKKLHTNKRIRCGGGAFSCFMQIFENSRQDVLKISFLIRAT
jgi:hypothetical protein